jgi:hypothetical protein
MLSSKMGGIFAAKRRLHFGRLQNRHLPIPQHFYVAWPYLDSFAE